MSFSTLFPRKFQVLKISFIMSKEQFDSFKNNLQNFDNPIKKNNTNNFWNTFQKKKSSTQERLYSVLNLFIIFQTHKLDLNDFLKKYENQYFPPSISNEGELYSTTKSLTLFIFLKRRLRLLTISLKLIPSLLIVPL